MIKVYVNAFELDVTDAVLSVNDMCTWLLREEFVELEHAGRQRVMGFGERDGYLCGILLSARSHKNYITLSNKDGKTVASVRRTRQGELMADVNYFVLNKATGCGVLSAYYGSGGMGAFGNILAKLYRTEIESMRDTEISELGEVENDAVSDADEARIRRKYWRAKLSLVPIMADTKFSDGLKKISKFQRFDFVEAVVREHRFKPISGQVTKQRRSMALTMEGTTKTKMREFIDSFVVDYGITEGAVIGSTSWGDEVQVTISPDVFCLAKYDHDEVVTPDNIRLDEVADMPIFGTLMRDVNDRRELFA